MKKIILILLIVFITNLAFADKLIIPFSCYPKKIQQAFLENGYQLDLNGNDRDENSWGFLKNEGTSFTIYTYEPIKDGELEKLLKIIIGSVTDG